MFNKLKNNIVKIKLDEWQKNLYTNNKFLIKISEKQLSAKRDEIKNELNIIQILLYLIYNYYKILIEYFYKN